MVNSGIEKYTIVRLEEVESTNCYALEHISSFDDKSVVYTPNQTNGRGRYTRKWIGDGSSNIYMSIVLKPENTASYPFANLTQYLSVVVCSFLENEFNIDTNIKWPNDILVNGSKISGILAEAYTESGNLKGVVLGLGLNVNLSKKTLESIDQKATSISVLTGKNYDTDVLVSKLADVFFTHYDEFVKQGFAYIKDEYIQKCAFLGKNIQIREADSIKKYFAESIDDEGLLTVIDENNTECKIITGDVLC